MFRVSWFSSKHLAALLLALVFVISPGASFAADPCTNTDLNDVNFRIPKNKHKSRPNGVRKLKLKKSFSRQLHFQVRFGEDTRYTTSDPRNQSDWGKLLGFTTNRIHKNSIRLGWAWNPSNQKIDLGFYGYLDGQRTMARLTSVPTGEWADVSIRFDDGGMSLSVNGIEKSVRGDLGVAGWAPVSTWLLRTAYFGGDEKAPHTMHIDVRGIVVDDACQR
jgi:hypothetical protein